MNNASTPPKSPSPGTALSPATSPGPGRLMIDAPIRAFHWLFALSFAGAWLTAESERWRDVHVTLGYAFGGLLLFRVIYGLTGPRQARLPLLWHRVSGLGNWLRGALAGKADPARFATLAMGLAMMLLLALAAPLVLSGYASHVEWMGQEDALEEVHEFFANASIALVLAHLALLAVLSAVRGRNLVRPMITGRTDGNGPDLVKTNRIWLAAGLVLAFAGFVAWQSALDTDPLSMSAPGSVEGKHHGNAQGQDGHDRHRRHHDDDD